MFFNLFKKQAKSANPDVPLFKPRIIKSYGRWCIALPGAGDREVRQHALKVLLRSHDETSHAVDKARVFVNRLNDAEEMKRTLATLNIKEN